ncbi:MAG TPA: FAD:protein FMN transferase [Acidimicrobiales bacterium]|nr:FAD:protein FMN transferase [Acidimicrobiales bacterium]
MTMAPAPPFGSYRTRGLGTTAEILTTDPGAAGSAAITLDRGLEWIDLLASRFRADSELSRLNAARGGTFPVSADLAEALGVALRAARLTEGAVTPTVGAAMVALGYDRDFAALPSDRPGPLPPMAPVPPWEAVVLDEPGRTVRVDAGVQLDLGATAKAWAADRIAARAAAAVGCGVLVSLGGDVAMAGDAPLGGWSIGLADRCDTPARDTDEVVIVATGGLATSGTASRAWRREGRVIHHLVDPRTGRPAAPCWRTVTVAAGSCVDANIAATAAVVLGPDAPGWLSERCLPARLVSTSGAVTAVGSWPVPGHARP